MSWHEAFADQYDEWSARMTADIPFYVVARARGEGTALRAGDRQRAGRDPRRQATGQRVSGVDSSPAMLAQARTNAAAAGVDLDLHEGDMREFTVDGTGGADLLPVPRAAPPADLGRSATRVRAGRGVTRARRTVRVERVRVRPPLRRQR